MICSQQTEEVDFCAIEVRFINQGNVVLVFERSKNDR